MKDGFLSLNKQNRFIAFIGLSFAAILLSAFFLTLFGVIDLRIAEQMTLHPVLEFIINMFMFMVNMFFVFSISLGIFDKRIFLILAGYAPVYLLCCFFPTLDLFATVLIPLIYLCIYNFCSKRIPFKKFAINYLLFNSAIVIYQQLALFVKISFAGFSYCPVNATTLIIYSLDIILFYAYYYWEVKHCVGFNLVSFKANSIQQIAPFDSTPLDISHLKSYQRMLFNFLRRSYNILQLLVVLLIGFLNNTAVEVCVMLIVFWIGRRTLKKSWHGDTLTICSTITFGGFYILTKVTPPLSVSLFSCIALSALFVYILHRAGIHEDEYNALKAYKEERDAYIAKSRRGRASIVLETLSASHIDFNMLSDYVNGETLEILADKYNLSQSTLNRKINALTRK